MSLGRAVATGKDDWLGRVSNACKIIIEAEVIAELVFAFFNLYPVFLRRLFRGYLAKRGHTKSVQLRQKDEHPNEQCYNRCFPLTVHFQLRNITENIAQTCKAKAMFLVQIK